MQCSFCGEHRFNKLIQQKDGIICLSCSGFTYNEDEIGEEKQDMVARLHIGYEALHGYHFRDAKACFEKIRRVYPDCVDAHWGYLLAEYGITYVKGFYDGHITPIYCFRDYDPNDVQYFSRHPVFQEIQGRLIHHPERKATYQKKAEEIDRALDIFMDNESEKEIDVFICVKISQASSSHPDNKEKTVLDFPKAQEIAKRLEKAGKKVFFSYDSLTNNPDSDMEIWSNLLKSKKMLLIASQKDYLESVWVKSEWERWLHLDANGEHKNNLYLYLLGDASRLAKRLPEGLAGRQHYSEDREDKLIEDICGSEYKESDWKKEIEALQKRIAEMERANEQKEFVASQAEKKDGKIVYTDGREEIIPYGVTEIAKDAYKNQADIIEVILPDSVTSIGECAFYECSGLTSIEIPNGVTSIEDYAFAHCSGLTSIEIPNSVTSIGKAFYGCSGLTSISVKKGNPIYHSAGNCLIQTEEKILLCGCQNSIIPDNGSVTSIGEKAFCQCSGLTSVKIPNGVTSIGDDAFYECSGLTSVKIPNSVTSIGIWAFCQCSGLTSVKIPNSVTSMGKLAFYGCSGLTSIEIPSSVTSIGDFAFAYCSGLTSIEIPDSVTNIEKQAFVGCKEITICANQNSYAEQYAQEHDIPFQAVIPKKKKGFFGIF